MAIGRHVPPRPRPAAVIELARQRRRMPGRPPPAAVHLDLHRAGQGAVPQQRDQPRRADPAGHRPGQAERARPRCSCSRPTPAPALGLLLAYMFFGKGIAKAIGPRCALIIQFLGGIHEVYFPYVLAKPRLILALIAGGMTGIADERASSTPGCAPRRRRARSSRSTRRRPRAASSGSRSVGPARPRSSLPGRRRSCSRLDTPRTRSTWPPRPRRWRPQGQEVVGGRGADRRAARRARRPDPHIVFACDAGMGSSAMGASVLRKKIKDAGHEDVTVVNKAISNLDRQLRPGGHPPGPRRPGAASKTPSAVHVAVDNFMASPRYDEIVELIGEANGDGAGPRQPTQSDDAAAGGGALTVVSGPVHRARRPGAVARRRDRRGRAGCSSRRAPSTRATSTSMHERETSVSTFMGNGLAIPHGTNEAKSSIHRTAHVVRALRRAGRLERQAGGVRRGHRRRRRRPPRAALGIAGIFTDTEQVAALRAAATPEEVMAVLDAVKVESVRPSEAGAERRANAAASLLARPAQGARTAVPPRAKPGRRRSERRRELARKALLRERGQRRPRRPPPRARW